MLVVFDFAGGRAKYSDQGAAAGEQAVQEDAVSAGEGHSGF